MPLYDWAGHDKEFITPCKNGGKCRQLMFEELNQNIPFDYPKHGSITVITTSEKHDIPQWRGRYKCCTLCHLPLNLAEAEKANRFLGKKLDDVKIDDDFMELLNGL